MDFLEDLFDFGDKRRGKGRRGDDDHDDHDDDRRGGRDNLTCTKCSKPVMANAKFCSNCGSEMAAQAFCPKCGKKVVQGAAFCQECGTKVNK